MCAIITDHGCKLAKNIGGGAVPPPPHPSPPCSLPFLLSSYPVVKVEN